MSSCSQQFNNLINAAVQDAANFVVPIVADYFQPLADKLSSFFNQNKGLDFASIQNNINDFINTNITDTIKQLSKDLTAANTSINKYIQQQIKEALDNVYSTVTDSITSLFGKASLDYLANSLPALQSTLGCLLTDQLGPLNDLLNAKDKLVDDLTTELANGTNLLNTITSYTPQPMINTALSNYMAIPGIQQAEQVVKTALDNRLKGKAIVATGNP